MAHFKKQKHMKTIRLIILCLTILLSDLANGQSIIQLGPNYFSAGIPSQEFEFYSAALSCPKIG